MNMIANRGVPARKISSCRLADTTCGGVVAVSAIASAFCAIAPGVGEAAVEAECTASSNTGASGVGEQHTVSNRLAVIGVSLAMGRCASNGTGDSVGLLIACCPDPTGAGAQL